MFGGIRCFPLQTCSHEHRIRETKPAAGNRTKAAGGSKVEAGADLISGPGRPRRQKKQEIRPPVSSQPKRFIARRAVLYSRDLTVAERLLYVLLDDFAGDKGECFPFRKTLSDYFGVSDRQLDRMLAKLRTKGFITSRKRQHTSAMFTLFWASEQTPDVSSTFQNRHGSQFCMSSNVSSDASLPYMNKSSLTKRRASACRECGSYQEAEERVRCVCGAVHDPATAPELDAIEETRRMLFGYIRKVGLSWPEPDDEICTRTLNAAGGSLPTLYARLKVLLLDRHRAPGKSYAWFPAVIADDRGSRRSA
jgi:hypothetical protein